MSGTVTGAPRMLLRLESLLIGLFAVAGYSHIHGNWGLFALLILLPDISMLGYLAGPKTGAVTYNVFHWYVPALCSVGIGAIADIGALTAIGLIWVAHIGFDRTIGYGLKYSEGFGATHLSVAKAKKAD